MQKIMDALQYCYMRENAALGREFSRRIQQQVVDRQRGRKVKPAAAWFKKAHGKLNKRFRYYCEYVGIDWADFQRERFAPIEAALQEMDAEANHEDTPGTDDV